MKDMDKKHLIKQGDIHDGLSVELKQVGENIYISKPRNANTEIAMQTFLLRLEEKGFLYIPGTVNIIHNENNLHYVEVIDHLSVQSVSEISLYYRRSGALLFLAYLFSSIDLHRENIIAHGAFPTLIDYETLFTGMTQSDLELTGKSLVSSVYASQLLPYWKRYDGNDFDMGGLSGTGTLDDKDGNILYFKEEPVFIYQYVSDVLEGFSYAYDFALENRGLFEEGIALFNECSFRVILRPTQVYLSIGRIIKKAAENDREKLARALLERAYLNDIDPNRIEKAEKVLKAEIEAVLQEEVPLFFVKGDSTHLQNRKGLLQTEFYINSPIKKATDKLGQLSIDDKNAQCTIIKQCLEAIRPARITRSKRCESIMDVFRLLEDNCINGLASCWTYLTRGGNECLYYQSVGYGLYHGLIGILCCYAAIYARTKDASVLNALYRHYAKYRENAIPDTIELDSFISSLNQGAGGHILALSHISDLTKDDRFLKDAQLIARAIVLPKDLPEESVDVLSGYSGLAIALSVIEPETSIPLAKRLLKVLLDYSPELTGMAHGAAGVALALCTIYQVLKKNTPEDNLWIDLKDIIDDKVLQLLKWENSNYRDSIHNWLDLRDSSHMGNMMGWCSGAPGIAMARKKIMEMTDNLEIKKICATDIGRAIDSIIGYEAGSRDCLCCGNCARLMAASYLNIDVDHIYKEVLARMKKGIINFHHVANTNDFVPGLMQGYAGVGYALAMYGDTRAGQMLL